MSTSPTVVAADLCVGYRKVIREFLDAWDTWHTGVHGLDKYSNMPLPVAEALRELRRSVGDIQ